MQKLTQAVALHRQDAHLTTLGYRVLRFTERQVTRDAATVAARLRALLPTSASR